MKKVLLISAQLLIVFFCANMKSQTAEFSPNRIFDTVSDGVGRKFLLSDINTASARQLGTATVNMVPVTTCTAGRFMLYFENGSIFTQTPALQTVACKVAEDISSFITPPTGTPDLVRIYCRTTNTGLAAFGKSFYVFAQLPTNPNQGYIRSQVEKTMISGVDAFNNLPATVFPGANNYYHGYLEASSQNWNTNMNTLAIGSTEIDAYSAFLHEFLHLLGIQSLIDNTGYSKLGQANNYYSAYDKFLCDPSGNPLLSPSFTSCPTSSVTFNSSYLSSISSATTGCITDITTCSTAAKYMSSSTTVTLYVPNCWEQYSSLSHFEDMCTYPSTFTASCIATPSTPGFNNQYFVMSNSVSSGPCYVKRVMTEEEKMVLCDLGYSVTGTYTSSVILRNNTPTASITYTSGACSPTNIIGNHDGLINNVYTYTTSTPICTISVASILGNDVATGSLSISCMEVVYGNATVTPGTSIYTITASGAGVGMVLLKYLPATSAGFGNITYVYVYFVPPGCNAMNNCNLVQNGGFEDGVYGTTPCGQMGSISGVGVGCWSNYLGYADLFTSGCGSGIYNLGVNTLSLSSPVNSYNSSVVTNTEVVGIRYDQQTTLGMTSYKNALSAPLTPSTSYKFSAWIINQAGASSIIQNPNNLPVVVTIASNPVFAFTPSLNFPTGLNVLAEFTVNAGTTWSQLTNTFTFPSTLTPNSALIIGINSAKTASLNPTYTNVTYYCFIDDVSLIPIPSPSLVLPSNTLCTTQSYTDIGQYFSVSATFTGTGITYNSGQYDFNASASLTPGVYPVIISYTTGGGCTYTLSEAITVINNCCASTLIPTFTNSVVNSTLFPSGATVSGMKIASNVTVQAGGYLTLSAEVNFTTNVNIVVENSGTLAVTGAHLKSCGTDMWSGIVVKDGGLLQVYQNPSGAIDNLIEDAITAIDYSSNGSSPNATLSISNTTFNKNYVGINISNYTRTVTPYPFSIQSCVFTSRNLPFISTAWPQTGTSNSTSTYSFDLRYVSGSTPTTGLTSPYLNQSGLTVANLLNPHSSETAHIAIQMNTVGITNGNNFYDVKIGNASNTAYFNLFDSHDVYILGFNSNVTAVNNAYQNTRAVNVVVDQYGTKRPAGAVMSYNTGATLVKLDLTESSVNTGNRFWNCHRGVAGYNLYRFNIENGLFRSTQSTTNSAGVQQGNTGILLNTNRFQYFMRYNEFTNIANGINVPLISGQYTSTPFAPAGIYAANLSIIQNTFSAVLSGTALGTNFLGKAVNISCPNSVTPNIAPANTVTPFVVGAVISQNSVNKAFRGIYVTGLTGFKTAIERNNISLTDDVSGLQDGIALFNSAGTSGQAAQSSINGNTLSAQNTTNTQMSLVECSNNTGIGSPSVCCNELSNSYNGFVFNSNNIQSVWAGNLMSPMANGLVLDQNGTMGQQGTSSVGSNNQWLGSSWSGNHTYVDNTSDGINSILYVSVNSNPTIVTTPTNNAGPASAQNYNLSNANIFTLNTGFYNCIGIPNNLTVPLPNLGSYSDIDAYHIAESQMYRFLQFNDSVRTSSAPYTIFYNNLQSGNTGALMEVEQNIYIGDYATANTFNNSLISPNAIEINYQSFYASYINYLNGSYTVDDSTQIANIANLCPGDNGACVFQARALFNAIYNLDVVYPQCGDAASKMPNSIKNNKTTQNINWEVSIFPNPANNKITVVSKKESEVLNIEIRDVNNKLLLTKSLNTSSFFANLDLALVNAVYFVTIKNSDNESVVKKLLINK